MGVNCCVVGCKNNYKNSNCKFYRFPKLKHQSEQRKKWIAAVRINNTDGSKWEPKSHDLICSAHFVGGIKSFDETSPSYIPTIFAYNEKKINETSLLNRHKRFIERRKRQLNTISEQQSTSHQTSSTDVDHDHQMLAENDTTNVNIEINSKMDQATQANVYFQSRDVGKTFICNRYISHNVCDAETQTDVNESTVICIKSNRQFKDKGCATEKKNYKDQETETETKYTEKYFAGISSIKDDDVLIDVAGVTFENFNFLLKRTEDTSNYCKISKKNRLLIFLVKMRTGMTFSAIAAFFNIHRTTVSNIFFAILNQLAIATSDYIKFPPKHIVQATMPPCFRPDYSNTRVIIDCTEFRIQMPSTVDHKVFCYSHYKKGFTAKVLIGATPGGYICFKSKIAGGRKTDTNLTIESQLVDELEDGDTVMGDRGFPQIRAALDESGKKVLLVIPPFLKGREAFDEEENNETYRIARVRIHIERIMQRLRLFLILDKIPHCLFDVIDDILHVCCVLVNLQPPIIAFTNDNFGDEKEGLIEDQ